LQQVIQVLQYQHIITHITSVNFMFLPINKWYTRSARSAFNTMPSKKILLHHCGDANINKHQTSLHISSNTGRLLVKRCCISHGKFQILLGPFHQAVLNWAHTCEVKKSWLNQICVAFTAETVS